MTTSSNNNLCDVCCDASDSLALCLNNRLFELSPRPCSLQLCQECLQEYFTLCRKERVLPRCPTCRALFQPVAAVVARLQQWLDDGGSGELWRDERRMAEMVRKLVEERQSFLVDNFPPSLARLANIMFPDRLAKVGREQRDRLRMIIERSSGQPCGGHGCWGATYENARGNRCCYSCGREQCKECQEKFEDSQHRCDPEVLANLKLIKQVTVECPGCGTAVQRSEGCNNMTCSRCGANFLYTTGQLGGAGNHGQNSRLLTVESLAGDADLLCPSPLFFRWRQLLQKCLKPGNDRVTVRGLYRKAAKGLFLAQQQELLVKVRRLMLVGQDQGEQWTELECELTEAVAAFQRIMNKYHVREKNGGHK